MAQRVQVLLVCDLHDGGEEEGAETVAFALDGSSYEIDLCADHAAAMRDDLATYVGAARRAGRSSAAPAQRRAGRPAGARAGGADKQRVQEIRQWARTHGHQVSERGRLSAALVEAYDKAH